MRFTEEQIIGVLREQEAGMKTADICRKHGISDATFYKWKAPLAKASGCPPNWGNPRGHREARYGTYHLDLPLLSFDAIALSARGIAAATSGAALWFPHLVGDALDGEGAVFRIFFANFSYGLVRRILSPCIDGIHVRIPIDDDALWRLAIDGYD